MCIVVRFCSSVGLERESYELEVAGSNPASTIYASRAAMETDFGAVVAHRTVGGTLVPTWSFPLVVCSNHTSQTIHVFAPVA